MTVWSDEFEEQGKRSSVVIWAIAATLAVFLAWAAFAWVDEIVRSQGTVVSSSRPQIVQNLEGGILAELNVSEGDTVEPGAGAGPAARRRNIRRRSTTIQRPAGGRWRSANCPDLEAELRE
jgi:hypothetical protein